MIINAINDIFTTNLHKLTDYFNKDKPYTGLGKSGNAFVNFNF